MWKNTLKKIWKKFNKNLKVMLIFRGKCSSMLILEEKIYVKN